MTMQGVLNTLRAVHHVCVRVDGPREVRVDLPGDPVVLTYAPVRKGGARGSEGRVLYGRSVGASQRQPILLDGKHVDAIRCIWPKERSGSDADGSSGRVLTIMVGMPELELETDGPSVQRGDVIRVRRTDTRFMDEEEVNARSAELARELLDVSLLTLSDVVDGDD